jgi:hypothetical protein
MSPGHRESEARTLCHCTDCIDVIATATAMVTEVMAGSMYQLPSKCLYRITDQSSEGGLCTPLNTVQNPSFNQFFQFWEITQVPLPNATADTDLQVIDAPSLVWRGDGLFTDSTSQELTGTASKQWQTVQWSPTAESGTLGASVEFEQWVEVCPETTYAFTVEFQYTANSGTSKPAAGDCSLSLQLGWDSKQAVVIDWTTITAATWTKETANTYTTWEDENSIPLSITLSCANSLGFTTSPGISALVDDVRLVIISDDRYDGPH